MQRIELSSNEISIFCPFCGTRIIDNENDEIGRCPHVLFIATDEGLEYCSNKIDDKSLELDAAEVGWDEATDKLELNDSLKFALYQPAPSFFGSYVGFVGASDI